MPDISIPAALAGILLLSQPSGDKMSKADIQREMAYLTFHAMDWGQTLDIVARSKAKNSVGPCDNGGACIKHSRKDAEFHERNPLLGRNPSKGKVNRHFASTALLHIGVSKFLSKKNRKLFQGVTIGVEGGQVFKNFSIGLKVDF